MAKNKKATWINHVAFILTGFIIGLTLVPVAIKKKTENIEKRIKNQEVGTRNSMLYTYLLAETRNMLLNAVNMVKSQRDFVKYSKK